MAWKASPCRRAQRNPLPLLSPTTLRARKRWWVWWWLFVHINSWSKYAWRISPCVHLVFTLPFSTHNEGQSSLKVYASFDDLFLCRQKKAIDDKDLKSRRFTTTYDIPMALPSYDPIFPPPFSHRRSLSEELWLSWRQRGTRSEGNWRKSTGCTWQPGTRPLWPSALNTNTTATNLLMNSITITITLRTTTVTVNTVMIIQVRKSGNNRANVLTTPL